MFIKNVIVNVNCILFSLVNQDFLCLTNVFNFNSSIIQVFFQIGVEGGIKEVMQHYKNDIFDRRDKLMNKCQHLQKIIDQYIERMQLDNNISNHYVTDEDFIDETLKNEIILQNNENVPLPDNNETESIVEVNTQFQSLLEGVQNECQPTIEENIGNTELELTEPVYIDNISDIESKMDNNSRSIESITNDPMEIRDRKINNITSVNTKIMDFDLLKPLTFSTDDNITYENRLNVKDCFTKVDKEKVLKEWKPSFESFSERKKKMKLLDINEVKQMFAHLYPPEVEHAQKKIRVQSELEKGFEIFKKSFVDHDKQKKRKKHSKRNKSSKDAGPSQTIKNIVQDNSTPCQTFFVSNNSDRDKAIILDTNNTIHNISNNNLNVSDNDLVFIQPKSLSDK